MPGGAMDRFMGGSPLGVLVRLVVLSLLVGYILHSLGITPGDILLWIQGRLSWLLRNGWSALLDVGSWILVGAVIVVPLWLLTRLFARRR